MPSSKELIEMAKKEWENREERRGLHDRISWEIGWISGYLSHSNTPERDKALAKAIQLQKDVEAAFNKKIGEYNPTSIMIVQRYVAELRTLPHPNHPPAHQIRRQP